MVNAGVLDPNGVPKARTYGLALAHSIPKMRTTLDLGTGNWDQPSPSPTFPADEVLRSTLGSTTKGGRDPYKLADWPLPRAITLVPSHSAPELPVTRPKANPAVSPPPQPPQPPQPPPRSGQELEAAVQLAEARAAARPVTLTLHIGVDGAVSAATTVVGPVPGAAKVALSAAERAVLKRCHELGVAYEAGLSLPETVGLTVQILRRRHKQSVGPLPKLDQSMMRLRYALTPRPVLSPCPPPPPLSSPSPPPPLPSAAPPPRLSVPADRAQSSWAPQMRYVTSSAARQTSTHPVLLPGTVMR